MASPQQQTNRRAEVEFPPNIPITLQLAYSEPRPISGRGGERYLYSTTDNRVFFCDPPVAALIADLAINVRESFTITRKSSGKRGEQDTWEVARIAGEQPNGTMVVPRLPNGAAPAAPKPPQSAREAQRPAGLVEEGKALVAAYAEILEWSLGTYQGKVKPDEVRALTISAYIQRRAQLASVA